MTGGFNNSIVGGVGNLIRTFIRSPNYVTGVSGWTINKDGSAEFNNLTIRGTFQGTLFVINNNGAFFYFPTEAAGNLIASIASSNGTDPFGNAYKVGIASYGGGDVVKLFSNALSWDNLVNPPLNPPLVSGNPDGVNGNSIEISSAQGKIGGIAAALTLYDSDASSGVSAIPTGTPGIFQAGGCFIYSDVWNTLGGGLGIANLTSDHGRYRWTPWGTVEIDVLVRATGAVVGASGNFANSLAVAYRPAFTRSYPLMGPLAQGPGRVTV